MSCTSDANLSWLLVQPSQPPCAASRYSAAEGAPPGQETTDGWTAVCLAMMTAPEMVLY